MPCYLDTIIKIKHVRQNETKDAKSISVWAIGLYPVGHEDNEIEVVLYVPRSLIECDPDSQAIFKRDEYYSVGGKIIPSRYAGSIKLKMSVATSTHLTITNRASESNKCPLKISLVGTPQGKPTEIENTDNSIIEMIITDNIGQDYNFTIYVVFPHTNPRFEHLKTTIQPQESIIFVVGQMEIIDNKFYVNAKDITYIDVKKKNSDPNHLHIQSTSTNLTRSKLLHVHQNITKNLKDTPVIQTPTMTTSSDIESESSIKRKRSEETDQFIDIEFNKINDDCKSETNEANFNVPDQEEPKKPAKKNKSQKNPVRSQAKCKERPIRTTRKATNQHYPSVSIESDKE